MSRLSSCRQLRAAALSAKLYGDGKAIAAKGVAAACCEDWVYAIGRRISATRAVASVKDRVTSIACVTESYCAKSAVSVSSATFSAFSTSRSILRALLPAAC